MTVKPKFRFSQANWVTVAVFALIPVLVGNLLKGSIGLLWGYGFGILLGLGAIPLLGRYLMSYIEYHDNEIVYKPGRVFSKRVHLRYQDISEVRYQYGRFIKLLITTPKEVLQVPPPVTMQKAKELTEFLVSRNQLISVELHENSK